VAIIQGKKCSEYWAHLAMVTGVQGEELGTQEGNRSSEIGLSEFRSPKSSRVLGAI